MTEGWAPKRRRARLRFIRLRPTGFSELGQSAFCSTWARENPTDFMVKKIHNYEKCYFKFCNFEVNLNNYLIVIFNIIVITIVV